ncbi:MAG: hypothetical protein KDJ47_05650 [Hyphomicrobiaceae bacterium]|nr:hypothetical protein [Hyphomicrobiaceae bacterium]
MILANALTHLRPNQSLRAFSARVGVDRRSLAALEAGNGTLETVNRVAAALDLYLFPHPRYLRNKRRHLGLGLRSMPVDKRTLQALESTGSARVESYEAVCAALDERPELRPVTVPWYTPKPLLDAMLTGLGIDQFDLDPASPAPPTVPTAAYYTEQDGGLWLPWEGRTVYCNPPYSEMIPWTLKALAEVATGRAERLLFLIPYRPETRTHRWLLEADSRFLILDKRVTFGGRKYHLDSASALVCFGLTDTEFRSLAATLPPCHELSMSRVTTMDQEAVI